MRSLAPRSRLCSAAVLNPDLLWKRFDWSACRQDDVVDRKISDSPSGAAARTPVDSALLSTLRRQQDQCVCVCVRARNR